MLSQLVRNPDEVAEIFNVPLATFLHLPSSSYIRETRRNEGHKKVQHSFEDLEWLNKKLYRLHQFDSLSFPNPITGLTADILITTALIATFALSAKQDQEEEGEMEGSGNAIGHEVRLGFERRAPGQMSWEEIVVVALSIQGFEEKGLIVEKTIST